MHRWPPFQRRRNKICRKIVKYMLSNCSEMLKLGTDWNTWLFFGQWISLHDRLQNGPKPVTNAWIDWFHIFITHVHTNIIVMWVILQNNADWDCFRTPILREILRTSGEHCSFLKVIHLFQQVGCARNKLQFHTVQQNPKSSLWTLDWDWMVCLLWNYGIWSFVLGNTKQNHDRTGQPVVGSNTSHAPVQQSRGMFKRVWKMLTVFPQTSNFRIKKLCCMCLRTTKQWSRWFLEEEVP